MKGCRSIFQNILFDDAPQVAELPIPERKGRSEALKMRQNEKIVCRYYYYIKIQGLQYEMALKVLENEIDLSQRTIIDIINRNATQLKSLQQLKPDLKYFRSKYPYFNWEYRFQ